MMENKNMTEDFYNKSQNASEFYERTINYDMKNIYKPFIEQVMIGGHILDAGCGPGRDSLYFIKNGYKITSMDASEEMIKIASKLTEQNAIKMRFQEMDFDNDFDGIWANASLLHVSKEEMSDVMDRLTKALKKDGIMFTSLKYGDKEEVIEGRFFNFYNEDSWEKVLENCPGLNPIKIWKQEDSRSNFKGQYWICSLSRRSV
jgi:cyclopropane fatty-acyl-phospholipid synthase-like methyltransferase